tara:strand:+ start:2262 stop:3230 length:969 start_codon:yes stop_codon:yes gene_type:complete
MDFVIRTHASPEVGFGHLNRCKILSDAIRSEGGQVKILVNSHPSIKNFVNDSKIKFFKDINHIEWPDADCCIVDLYCFETLFYKKLSKIYKKLIIFDDFNYKVPSYVSGVINGNIYAKREKYPIKIKSYIGVDYFLMRTEFLGKKQFANAKNILVCMGGSDPEEQTDRVLKVLSEVTKRKIDVVFGPGFEDKLVIQKWSSHPRTNIHISVSNMSFLMERAAFCVSSAGSILYELSHLGIPTICISLIEHQRLIAEAFSKINAVNYIGYFDEISNSEIAREIKILDQNKSIREKLSKNSRFILDGLGSQRLAKELMNWIQSKN